MKHAQKILLLAMGNPARGDDGLGPALASHFERHPIDGLGVMWNYQASIEDAADVAEHESVIFADASGSGAEPFGLHRVLGVGPRSLSSHDVAPEAVITLARQALGWQGRAYLLGIRGYEFGSFVERLSDRAAENLSVAATQLSVHIASGTLESIVTDAPTTTIDRHGAPWPNATH